MYLAIGKGLSPKLDRMESDLESLRRQLREAQAAHRQAVEKIEQGSADDALQLAARGEAPPDRRRATRRVREGEGPAGDFGSPGGWHPRGD
jgi:hypothetical protein